jgi:HK97 gp10 family phage protein
MARKRVEGNSRLRRQLRKFPETMREELTKALVDGGEELRAELEMRAPRDEGKLQAAPLAKLSSDKLSVLVGFSKDRPGFKKAWLRGGFEALFIEFGTKHSAAQPFVRPAYRAKLSRILDRIDEGRRAAVKRIVREP